MVTSGVGRCLGIGDNFLALFFNCEETTLVASTCIEGHALTSCILLLLVAVAVATVTATSPLASKKDKA